MASEAKILEAIFGPSIPTEKAAVLPAIMGHIKAIEDLLQGVPRRQAHPRITDPAISGPINSRIEVLYAEISRDRPDIAGKIWPKIAAAICQEFGVSISPDACRSRYKDAMGRQEAALHQEGYATITGQAIQAGVYITPPEVLQLAKEAPADLIVDPKPGEQAGPYDRQIVAMKTEAIRRHNAGEDIKAIAESLGVRWQWVRAICAKAPKPEPSSAIIREQPAPVVPLNAMDARIQEMAEQGAMVHEICIAINRNFNHNYSTAEMAEKIRKLQGGANASR